MAEIASLGVAGKRTAASESELAAEAKLAARVSNLHVERGALSLATLDARVTGDWRLVEPSTGALDYSVQVASLEPFGPYLPGPADQGAGSFSAEGTISGTIARSPSP